MQPVILVPVKYMLVFQLVCILSNILAALEGVALLDVIECEEDLVLLAQVVSSVVYRRAVSSRRLHQVKHHSGNIYLVSSWKWLLLSCLVGCISTDSSGVLIIFLLKEGSDSVLSSELLPCFFRQVVDHLASESDAGHGV